MFICTPFVSVNRDRLTSWALTVRCKLWSCPHCSQVNRWRVIRNAAAGQPNKMLTLTLRSTDYESPEEAAQELKRGWRALQKRIAREFDGLKIPFLAVFERHKSGWPHLHLLIRSPYLEWNWLTEQWNDITGSPGIDIRAIRRGKKAAKYVAKYIGKDLSTFENCKRWWRSHDYNEEDDEDWQPDFPLHGWGRQEGDLRSYASFLGALGAKVTFLTPERITWNDPATGPIPFRALAQGSQGWFGHVRERFALKLVGPAP